MNPLRVRITGFIAIAPLTTLLIALLHLDLAKCFIAVPSNPNRSPFVSSPTAIITPRSQTRSRAFLRMSDSSSVDLSGKLIAQRYIYRLSPTKSSVTAPYTIEERQYYSVSEDRTSLEPHGDKRFFLRADDNGNDDDRSSPPEGVKKSSGQPRTYTRIGPSLYKMVHQVRERDDEDDEDSELGLTVWNSSFAMTLYCMANPHLVEGNVLELGSGVGIGAILSCIGAGFAAARTDSGGSGSGSGSVDNGGGGGFQSIEDIGSSPSPSTKSNYAPVPPEMKQLTLTDNSLPVLKRCVDNIKNAAFPPSRVDIHQLDWSSRVPTPMVGKFDCILACDCAYYFPLVAPLARTMAYSLRTSPYYYANDADNNNDDAEDYSTIDDDDDSDANDNGAGRKMGGGRFLHVGPEHRDSIRDLRTKLSRGYRMETTTETLVLEQFDLVPLVLDSLEGEEEQLREEVEGGASYVEYQSVDTSRFTVVAGSHHEDYDGFNGDYFFPVETGNEDNSGSDGKGRELGYGVDGDGGGGGGGQWLG